MDLYLFWVGKTLTLKRRVRSSHPTRHTALGVYRPDRQQTDRTRGNLNLASRRPKSNSDWPLYSLEFGCHSNLRTSSLTLAHVANNGFGGNLQFSCSLPFTQTFPWTRTPAHRQTPEVAEIGIYVVQSPRSSPTTRTPGPNALLFFIGLVRLSPSRDACAPRTPLDTQLLACIVTIVNEPRKNMISCLDGPESNLD